MIDQLRVIIEQVEQLPPDERAALARSWAIALDELEWQRVLRKPGAMDVLERMADEAEAEHTAGLSEEITGDTWR